MSFNFSDIFGFSKFVNTRFVDEFVVEEPLIGIPVPEDLPPGKAPPPGGLPPGKAPPPGGLPPGKAPPPPAPPKKKGPVFFEESGYKI